MVVNLKTTGGSSPPKKNLPSKSPVLLGLETYQPKTFDLVFNGAHVMNRIIIRLLYNGAEYIFFIYLTLYAMCKKVY